MTTLDIKLLIVTSCEGRKNLLEMEEVYEWLLKEVTTEEDKPSSSEVTNLYPIN